MSYLQFPKTQSIVVLDSADKLDLGGFQPASNGELRHVVLNIYKHGAVPTSTKFRVGLHLSTDFSTAFALSDEIFMTAVEALVDNSTVSSKDYWRAWVRFDFSRPNLNKNQEYRFSLQTVDYTRTADTAFVGAIKQDANDPIYANGTSGLHEFNLPLGKAILAFKEPS